MRKYNIKKEMIDKVGEYFSEVDEEVMWGFRELLGDGVCGRGMDIEEVKESFKRNMDEGEEKLVELFDDEEFNDMIVWDYIVNDFEYVKCLVNGG